MPSHDGSSLAMALRLLASLPGPMADRRPLGTRAPAPASGRFPAAICGEPQMGSVQLATFLGGNTSHNLDIKTSQPTPMWPFKPLKPIESLGKCRWSNFPGGGIIKEIVSMSYILQLQVRLPDSLKPALAASLSV